MCCTKSHTSAFTLKTTAASSLALYTLEQFAYGPYSALISREEKLLCLLLAQKKIPQKTLNRAGLKKAIFSHPLLPYLKSLQGQGYPQQTTGGNKSSSSADKVRCAPPQALCQCGSEQWSKGLHAFLKTTPLQRRNREDKVYEMVFLSTFHL